MTLKAQSVQPQRLMDGNVQLIALVIADEAMTEFDRHTFEITHDTAWNLALNLMTLLNSMGEERMRNAGAGECATCGNHRLVRIEREGRRAEWKACPDCRARYDSAAPAYPSRDVDAALRLVSK